MHTSACWNSCTINGSANLLSRDKEDDGLNRKAGLVVLEDDKGFFPEYNGAFLIREDTLTRFAQSAPDLEETLNLLAGKISNEDMVDMTYQVDVQGRSADEVAAEFLHSHGLLA